MDNATKEKLRALPTTRCVVCKTPRAYTNPMAKCSVCRKKFCYNHITIKLEKDGTVDYCDRCLRG